MYCEEGNRIKDFMALDDLKELIVATSPCGVLVIDHNGVIVAYNENLKRHRAFRDTDLLNKNVAGVMLYESKSSREDYSNPMLETLVTGCALDREMRLRTCERELSVICRVWTKPLRNKQGTITGVCGVFFDLTRHRRRKQRLQEMHRLLAEVSNQSSNQHIETIRGFAAAIAARDTYTRWHSEKVAEYAQQICFCLGVGSETAEIAYLAGLLHDVGKIGVPESILTKPGRLTYAEFEVIKKHPEIGVTILQSMRTMKDILHVIQHHHERYDGTGYPSGLKGDDIPLLSRVLTVADAFDAMTSDRSYRQAFPLEKAVWEIRDNAGSQFDPQVAKSFLGLVMNQSPIN